MVGPGGLVTPPIVIDELFALNVPEESVILKIVQLPLPALMVDTAVGVKVKVPIVMFGLFVVPSTVMLPAVPLIVNRSV